MNDTEFWSLIDKLDWAHEGDDDKVVEPLVVALSKLPEIEITSFENKLTSKLYALDGRAWACETGESIWWGEPDSLSTDGFLYARCVVVANGSGFYDSVLTDPRRMPKDMEFESLLYVAMKAYERKTGRDGDDVRDHWDLSYETFSNKAGWQTELTRPGPLKS